MTDLPADKRGEATHLSHEATLRVYRKIADMLWSIHATGNWSGSRDGRPAEEVDSEEMYLALQELKPNLDTDSPLYKVLESILDIYLTAGLRYGRDDYLNLCRGRRIYRRVCQYTSLITEFDNIIKSLEEGESKAESKQAAPQTSTHTPQTGQAGHDGLPQPWNEHRNGKKLIGWAAILKEIGVDNLESKQKSIKGYQALRGGPIQWVGRKPIVDQGAIRFWWDNLELKGQTEANESKTIANLKNFHEQQAQGLHQEKRPNSRGKIL